MDLLEEPTRQIVEQYRRRFNDPLDVSVRELDHERRSRLIAALERAIARNIPLLDYELEEFTTPPHPLRTAVRRLARRMAGRRRDVL